MKKKASYESLVKRNRELELQLQRASDRVQMLELRALEYQALFQHALHEIHVWRLVRDDAGEIVSWILVDANPAALKSWGDRHLNNLVGKRAEIIFPDSDPIKLFLPIVEKVFKTKEPHFWEIYFQSTDQTLSMTTIPFDDFFISAGVDVSDIARSKEAFRKAKIDADSANKGKSEFLANMSHEIRTPLHTITGILSLLEREKLTEKQQSYLNNLKAANASLLGLVNDVLDLSKIESNAIKLENIPFSLSSVIAQVTHAFSTLFAEKNVEFITPDLNGITRDVLIGDPTRLSQILTNLISNALKFTHAGSVTVGVMVKPPANGDVTLILSVKDTGIGISEDKLSTILQPFKQADTSTTRLYGGSGLGLSIVSNLVTLMNGQLSVTSTLGEGSTFTVQLRLPLCYAPDCLPQDADDRLMMGSSPLTGIRILVVDDDVMNIKIAKEALEYYGGIVSAATGGHEAIDWINKNAADIVLMDIQMPALDGFETTKTIRETFGLTALPIIGLSGGAVREHRRQALAIGMVDYITKPVDPSIIKDKIIQHLDRDLTNA